MRKNLYRVLALLGGLAAPAAWGSVLCTPATVNISALQTIRPDMPFPMVQAIMGCPGEGSGLVMTWQVPITGEYVQVSFAQPSGGAGFVLYGNLLVPLPAIGEVVSRRQDGSTSWVTRPAAIGP